jgi:hypothetical protein
MAMLIFFRLVPVACGTETVATITVIAMKHVALLIAVSAPDHVPAVAQTETAGFCRRPREEEGDSIDSPVLRSIGATANLFCLTDFRGAR